MNSDRRKCNVLDEDTGEVFVGYFERYGDSIVQDFDNNKMLQFTIARLLLLIPTV
ncbi:MAG: hypothetical protein GY714_09170 [Desulfobacterales bacterium]|nr:hypothetical protein [Desulfobacterales bacterium]